jgi:4-alpha-glucanotransferase
MATNTATSDAKKQEDIVDQSGYESDTEDYVPEEETNPIKLKNNETMEQLRERLMKTPAAEQWKKIGVRHHHGVVVPVFSLKGKDSSGVGEFLDLIPFMDWCKQNKFEIIQLLPLNHTNLDNSPFSPISSFALNIYLISLRKLPAATFDRSTPRMVEIMDELISLNSCEYVNWKKVRPLKHEWLREYYNLERDGLTGCVEFINFVANNQYWLPDYALFCVLKEKNDWKYWEEWTVDSSPEGVKKLREQYKDEIQFYEFLQFLCHQQMSQVRSHADQNGMYLKGDVPFLVSKDSADVWMNKNLFKLECNAGAPPDMYSATGQDWGLPTYNWPAMEKDGYKWWKVRLSLAQQYFHLYRIDHIVGFFRIWAVPKGKPATKGSFDPKERNFWIPQGEKLLRMLLANSNMLPIGEDLGTVPSDVRDCLQRLGISGTKVIRWERQWKLKEEGQPFIPYAEYNGDSMTTVSTHDSTPLSLWWHEQPEEAQAFSAFKEGWKHTPEKPLPVDYRMEILRDSHTTPSLFHINLLQEYLALVPSMMHNEPALERINIPGKLLESNWSYRMRPTLEEIADHAELRTLVNRVIDAPQS